MYMILGQTTCNQGSGRVMYERLPNQQLQGFDDDVVSFIRLHFSKVFMNKYYTKPNFF